MMRRRSLLRLIATVGMSLSLPTAAADGERDSLGKLRTQVFFGTDKELEEPKCDKATAHDLALLQQQDEIRFRHYYRIGSDVQTIYRSDENWSKPLKNSEKIMCRFEVEDIIGPTELRLQLELWLQNKKILKSSLNLSKDKPVFVFGPHWRKGRLVIALNLE